MTLKNQSSFGTIADDNLAIERAKRLRAERVIRELRKLLRGAAADGYFVFGIAEALNDLARLQCEARKGKR